MNKSGKWYLNQNNLLQVIPKLVTDPQCCGSLQNNGENIF